MIHPMTYAGLENAPTIGASSSRFYLDRLVEKAQELWEVEKELITGTRRLREVVMARQAIMYVARQKLPISYREIGEYFGKDHATVFHACKTVRDICEFDDKYNKKVSALYHIL